MATNSSSNHRLVGNCSSLRVGTQRACRKADPVLKRWELYAEIAMPRRPTALILCLVVLLGPASGGATPKERKWTRRQVLWGAGLLTWGMALGSVMHFVTGRRMLGPSQREADRVFDHIRRRSVASMPAIQGAVSQGGNLTILVNSNPPSGVCVQVNGRGEAGSTSRRLVLFATEDLPQVRRGRHELTGVSGLSAQGTLLGWSESHGIWKPNGASGITAFEVTDAGKARFEYITLGSCKSGQGVTLIGDHGRPGRDTQFRMGSLILLKQAVEATQLGAGLFVAEPKWFGGAEGKCVGLVIDSQRRAAVAGPAIEKLIERTATESQRVRAGMIHEGAGSSAEGVPLPVSPLTAGIDTGYRQLAKGSVIEASSAAKSRHMVVTQVAKDGPAAGIAKAGMVVEQVHDDSAGWLAASDLALSGVLMAKGPGDVLKLRVRDPKSITVQEIGVALGTERDLFGDILTKAGFDLVHVRLQGPYGSQQFGLKANRDHPLPRGRGTWVQRDDVIVAARQWAQGVSLEAAKLLSEGLATKRIPLAVFKQALSADFVAVNEVTDLFGLLNGYGAGLPLVAAMEVRPRGGFRTQVRYLHPEATLEMSAQVNARIQRGQDP